MDFALFTRATPPRSPAPASSHLNIIQANQDDCIYALAGAETGLNLADSHVREQVQDQLSITIDTVSSRIPPEEATQPRWPVGPEESG